MKRALPILCGLVLAGCGSSSPRLSDAQLASLVLKPSDLPPVFARFDEGRQVRADLHPGPRASPVRFGRQGGWKARYKRSGTQSTRGPLVIESRADAFKSENGADKDLAAYGEELSGAESLRASVGERALGFTTVQPATAPVRTFSIAWREGRFTASVTVNGFDGKVTFEDALRLARRAQAHLEAVD